MSKNNHQNALPLGYDLLWYRIERVLGHGAFGITYLAHDINLERHVALKEYLPGQFCIRKSNQEVTPLSDEHVDDFKSGLERFLFEARTLTRFEHPNLIKVFNVFEANNTAYMVMNYEHGESLKQIHKHKKSFTEEELMDIILPLMSGLAKIHNKGFVHRDIKPGNIFIREDKTPVLLDFGSARRTELTNPQTLTNFVSPGYAPIEQYASKSDKQGPWTDIYGLAATIYKLVVGVAPINAIDRSEAITHDGKDCYIPLTELVADKYSETFLKALDHALAFRAQERPQDIRTWLGEFDAGEFELDTEPTLTSGYTNNFDVDESDSEFIDISRHNWRDDTLSESDYATFQVDADETTITATLPHTPGAWRKRLFITLAILFVFTITVFTIFKTSGPAPGFRQSWETLSKRMEEKRALDDGLQNVTGVTEVVTDTESVGMPQSPEIPPIPAAEEISGNAAEATDSTMPLNPVAATEQQPTEQSEAPVEEVDEKQLLLTRAADNFSKLNLTKPPGNNAYDQYRKVLKLDPGNKEAKTGIKKISDAYVNMAYNALDKDKTFEARRYINKAEQIWPESGKIESARKALNNKLADKYVKENEDNIVRQRSSPPPSASESRETSSQSLIEQIKSWFNQ